MRVKQLSLLKDPRKNTKLWWIVKQSTYGGSLNYRKVKRPFDSKKLTHAVFKARLGKSNGFLRNERMVREVIGLACRRYGISQQDLAVHIDHIHILFYTKLRESQIRFLRFVAAELGRKFKAFRLKAAGSMWVNRPFTRLVGWGRKSLSRVKKYIERNREEVMGFIPYAPRNHRLATFLAKWELRHWSSA
jgi:REP element-mobilizing transposase RayT